MKEKKNRIILHVKKHMEEKRKQPEFTTGGKFLYDRLGEHDKLTAGDEIAFSLKKKEKKKYHVIQLKE